MQDVLAVNNRYAAYSAASSNADKSVGALSRMLKSNDVSEKKVDETTEMSMDKVIISSEALARMKAEAV
ncbi:MAG: hypothetical protein LBV04_04140 [Deferribacteraceae bacterium]|jgi:hypothetical protein|nr:hypothetical protein [Deferribacteraceae bacterium]